MNKKETLNIVIVGHVDHGKSSLIGRMLYDTDCLPESKKAEVEAASKKRGEQIEWSFLLDSFQAERDQAITIDTTRIWFKTPSRQCVIIDAPGHREFLKNMISGAASADAAILVVDVAEGLQEQTRRHAYLLNLLGIQQVIVAMNKMDLVTYDQARFDTVAADVKSYLTSINIEPTAIVPISAREGDMLATHGDKMPWYDGKTIIEWLDSLPVQTNDYDAEKPLRFPVQDVYRMGDTRVLVGRIQAGSIKIGDTLTFSPTNETAEVTAIKIWPEDNVVATEAKAGQCVGITLNQRIFVERGHVASHAEEAPFLTNIFRLNLFWLDKQDLTEGKTYKIRFGTTEEAVTVRQVEKVIDTQDLKQDADNKIVTKNAVAQVVLRTHSLLPLDEGTRMVIYDGTHPVGGGTVNLDGFMNQRLTEQPKGTNLFSVDHLLTRNARARRNGHKGGVFWFTGLSGAGKSTIAMAAERTLFDQGYQTYVLDGDNVRKGLNADLGFSDTDRTENIRRIGEVAALMADAGIIVITAFISPFQADRDRARTAAPDSFHEIHVHADLETCEKRDPKGLYKKARAGEIKDFTGISSPYEAPDNPELLVDTNTLSPEECVAQVTRYIENQMAMTERDVRNAITF